MIVFDNVRLNYPLLDSSRSFRAELNRKIGGAIRREPQAKMVSVVALEGISCNIQSGDRVGVVGSNGSGKSTLLKLIAGVYPPTQGRLNVNGRVSSLLTIGLGMELDDTGIENIYSGGMYLGLSKSQLRKQMDDIAEFTELGEFLEMPMRTYSHGMQLRLAFAVATCFEPEILLLDEVFGAGDGQFAIKAHKRMRGFLQKASILMMTSHSIELIASLCNKVLWLDQGHMVEFGPAGDVLPRYQSSGKAPATA